MTYKIKNFTKNHPAFNKVMGQLWVTGKLSSSVAEDIKLNCKHIQILNTCETLK